MESMIRVSDLSKHYRIGRQREASYQTLRDVLAGAVRSPFGWLPRRARPREDEVWALRGVAFEVGRGDVVGIVGRNGAGKSTLLKVLSRITEPTGGRVEMWGRVASMLEVGTGFHPELTGRENVYLNGAILGMTRNDIRRRFDEIIAFSEVERFIDTPVKRYSSGMYLRLAFAVAAHLEPEVLIVDEVIAVGDLAFQRKCLGKMSSVAGEGRTVLFVSHNMDAVSKLCSRGILLEGGRVKTTGNAQEVVRRYVEGGAEARSSYEIEPPSEAEDAPGYAYRLTVEDEYGNPAAAVPVGRPWQVRVHFKIKRRTEHFIVGLGFRTPTEAPLRTSWGAPRSVEPGDYEALFREEALWLSPGRYPMVVGLSAYERSFQYAEAGALEVAEFSEGVELVKISGVGLLLNPLDVQLHKLG
jgi:lipopolysaccharide transport system ATP-binding protein